MQEESKEPKISPEERQYRIKQMLPNAIAAGAIDMVEEFLENEPDADHDLNV